MKRNSTFFSFVLLQTPTVLINSGALGFEIPSLGEVLTFAIRIFFVIAGLMALFALLSGALNWITSGGAKENIEKARNKIQAAVVGVILVVVVLSVLVTMEQVVFAQRVCFGLSCPITIPSLLTSSRQNNITITESVTNQIYVTPTPGPSGKAEVTPTPIPSVATAEVIATPTGTPSGYSAPYNATDTQVQTETAPTSTPVPTPPDRADYLLDVSIFRR